MSDLFRVETRRAAKSYRCDECRAPIEAGEKYERWFQIFEGDAFSGHAHCRCADMRAEAWVAFDWCDPEESAPFGELRSFLKEEHGVEDVDAWYAERVAKREAAALLKRQISEAAASVQGSPA